MWIQFRIVTDLAGLCNRRFLVVLALPYCGLSRITSFVCSADGRLTPASVVRQVAFVFPFSFRQQEGFALGEVPSFRLSYRRRILR